MRRLWLFRLLAAVVLPALLLMGLEGGLRLAGYGHDMSFLAARAQGSGETQYAPNPLFTEKYFGPRLTRECLPFSLVEPKPRRQLRVFLLGASAANGIPESAYGMARILEEMLAHRYPGVAISVLNVAITAINSHVVAEIARACARLEPDLFVVYLGNNEVVGPYGAGTVFSPLLSSPLWIGLHTRVRASRSGQLTGAVLNALGGGRRRPRTWGGMRMFLDRQVRASDPALQKVYRNFERNLRDLCATARKAGAPVVLSTVGVNLRDSAPFGSLHRRDLTAPELQEWEEHYRRGKAHLQARRFDEALVDFEAAGRIDDTYAELHFVQARCLEALGRLQEARYHYERARDLDTLRFRADSRIESIIRQVAQDVSQDVAEAAAGTPRARGGAVVLADAEAALDSLAQGGLPGRELFYEHVHLTFEGNYQVARVLLTALEPLLPEWVRTQQASASILSREECSRRLVRTGWERLRVAREVMAMIAQPPFTHEWNHPEMVDRQSQELDSLLVYARPERLRQAEAAYRAALGGNDPSWFVRYRYAAFQVGAGGDLALAVDELRVLVEEFPLFTAAHGLLGECLGRMGRYREARRSLLKSLALNPYQGAVHNNLGNCLWNLAGGEVAMLRAALEHYQKAYDLQPQQQHRQNLVMARLRLASLLARRGDVTAARKQAQAALAVDPENETAQRALSELTP